MSKQTRIDRFNFRGAMAPPLTASREGIWTKSDTSAAGAPTVQTGSSGAMELTLDATNEAQNIGLLMGDVLVYDIDDLIRINIIAAVSAGLNAAVSAAFGVAGARNDAIDSIAQHVLFRCIGSNALVAESDDGTTDVDDIATGMSLGVAFRRFTIDFAEGMLSQSPPSLSKGGKADVRLGISAPNGSMRRVGEGTRFDVSAYSGGLQLFAQLQKTANVAVATLFLLEYEVEYRLPI